MSLSPCSLSDGELISRVAALAAAERSATASLIEHLAELEARSLHLAYGFRSLFGYCRHVLHCSEHEAYNRMEVVRAARRFPVILPMLAEGRLHLTAVRLLAPHLEDEDHLALLGGSIQKSRREIVKRLACWFPSADVRPTVRKLPRPAAHDPTAVNPLSSQRYRLQVTLDEAAHQDLRSLQDLLRREIPDGDAAVIVARALELLRREAERKAFSATDRPRAAAPIAPASRAIPAYVERAVWERDGGQCAFEGHGRRCEERSFLEFHHVTPWVVGGQPTRENIALRCRAHNQYEAARYFAPINAAREVRDTYP